MLIDRKSVPWITVAAILFVIATGFYIPYAYRALHGPSGGSIAGLIYGIAGAALMFFAMLLALRKRLRAWRLGRTSNWVQGHVWLALLSYPLILYHAGFHGGLAGNLTWVMMWLFTLVVISGIYGVVIQNIIPRKMLAEVPSETIYDEIDHVIRELAGEAERIIETVAVSSAAEGERLSGGTAVAIAAAPAIQASDASRRLKDFFDLHVKTYLDSRRGKTGVLSDADRSRAAFEEMRRSLPAPLRESLADLESIVDERRQLEHQRRLHHWLHSWLLVHIPLSYALMILAVVHIIAALRFR